MSDFSTRDRRHDRIGRDLSRCAVIVGVILALSVPAVAIEADPYLNVIGIFTNAQDLVTALEPLPFTPFELSFVLLAPRTAGGEPVSMVDGFEYRVAVDGASASLVRLEDRLPPGWTAVGDASDLADASYLAGGTPVPVVDDVVVIQTWRLMSLQAAQAAYFYLGPVALPTVPGAISFSHPGETGSVAVAAGVSSGGYDRPVFCLFCFMIDRVQRHPFGEVKALYR